MFRWIKYVLGSPFWAASLVYGPYGLGRLFEFRAWMGTDNLESPFGGGLDPVLPKLFTARALVAAGVLAMLTRFALDPQRALNRMGEVINDIVTNGFMVMIAGPAAVLAVALVLILLAEDKAETALASLVPLGVGALSFLLVTVTFPSPLPSITEPVRNVIRWISNGSFRMPLVKIQPEDMNVFWAIVLIWVLFFIAGADYLAHRNGLCRTSKLPLMPPLVTILVVWATVWMKLAWGFPGFDGLQGFGYAMTVYATPVVASAIALVEIVLLHVSHDITFRAAVSP